MILRVVHLVDSEGTCWAFLLLVEEVEPGLFLEYTLPDDTEGSREELSV